MHIFIREIFKHAGEKVDVKGWLNNKRSSGSIAFLELRDGSGYVQGVAVKRLVDEKTWNAVQEVTQESGIIVSGKVSGHPKKPGVFELQISELVIVHLSPEYPIGNKDHGPEFLLDNRHLWLRSKRQWAIQHVRDEVISAIYDFFHGEGFVKIDTPIITPNACEGATELFEIDYFDHGKVFLSQSGQLYLEAAIMSVGRGFDFGPTFRAEKSKTRRHLTEFWMMDAEAAFIEHEENMQIQENMIAFIVERVLANCDEELKILERDIQPLKKITTPFERLEYTDAIRKLSKLGSNIKHGEDLGANDEELLTKDSDAPVFIHKWPKAIMPFYMKADPDNPEIVLNDDLIGTEKAGELIGGSQREDNYEVLKKSIESNGLDGPEYQWYLDLRKYGSVPHSGFGLGLERTVRWITGVKHIRETIPFPRMITRVRP